MKTVLCYGDSNTWGMMPMRSLTDCRRHSPEDRWPVVLQAELGARVQVILEGLNGRTTVHEDPPDGAHKSGRYYLLPCLESHAPLDAVVIMLGSNDLKTRFHLPAADIATGAGRLAAMVTGDDRGQNGLLTSQGPSGAVETRQNRWIANPNPHCEFRAAWGDLECEASEGRPEGR